MKTGGFIPGGQSWVRKYRIGATVYKGSVLIPDSNQYAEAKLATANSAADAFGFTLEAGTYAASSPHVFVTTEASPHVIMVGDVSASATKGTAFSTSTTGVVNLVTSASSSTVADTNVSTLDYTGGYLIPLTGTYAGHIRCCSTQTDNTSCAASVPWGGSLAATDYVLRTYGAGIYGIETVATYFDGFNGAIAATEALGDAIGEYVCLDVFVDDQSCAQSNTINIKNGTSPTVKFHALFADHVFNKA